MSKVVKLKKPIQHGSETIAELSFRPATAKDLRRMPLDQKYPIDGMLYLAGKLSGQPDAVIDKLEGEDLEEVVAIASGFMPTFRATGSES